MAVACAIVGAPEYIALLAFAAVCLLLLYLFVRHPELLAAAIVIAAIIAVILAL